MKLFKIQTPEEYQARLAQHEEEMLPLVGLLWGVVLAVILVAGLWELALKPLLQHLGIHI